MKKFIYKAKNYQNKIYKGCIYADSENDLREILSSEDLYLINYKVYNTNKFIREKIKINDLTFFSKQMSIMLKSGIELVNALTIVYKSCANKRLQEIIGEGIRDIDEGLPFSNTLIKYKEFPKFYVSMLIIGEKTGRMREAFDNLSKYYETNKENKRKLASAFSYPIILMILGMGVILLLLLKIIPIFVNIFNDFERGLPKITKIVLQLQSHLSSYYLYYILGLLIIILIFLIINKTKKGKLLISKIKINNFIFKGIYTNFFASMLVNGLVILLDSGSNISQSIEIMSKNIGNVYLENKMQKASQQIKEGTKVSKAIKQINYYPKSLVEMIDTGESCGQMDEILKGLNDYYTNEYDYLIKKSLKKIEPIMILVIGFIILFIILSIFIPMFEIMDTIGSNI